MPTDTVMLSEGRTKINDLEPASAMLTRAFRCLSPTRTATPRLPPRQSGNKSSGQLRARSGPLHRLHARWPDAPSMRSNPLDSRHTTGRASSPGISAAVYAGLSAFFGWAFYTRFWQWRHCIAEATSSCVIPEGTNLIAGGAGWSVPALICAALCLRRLIQARRAQQGAPRDGFAAREL